MALSEELNGLREDLEVKMLEATDAALDRGILTVAPFPEDLDISWLMCCSVPGGCPECAKGVFAPDPQGKLRQFRTPPGRPRTGGRRRR